MAGASSEAGRFRGPPQERAVGNFNWADQSAPVPAGRCPHFLHDESGDDMLFKCLL